MNRQLHDGDDRDPVRVETMVIGAGQAGLATGYHLARRGRDFVILDAGRRVGDNWRSVLNQGIPIEDVPNVAAASPAFSAPARRAVRSREPGITVVTPADTPLFRNPP